jgi:hypothetical protein
VLGARLAGLSLVKFRLLVLPACWPGLTKLENKVAWSGFGLWSLVLMINDRHCHFTQNE